MPVSRRLRFEVLRRDGHTCRYCGAKAPEVILTVDHVIPVALGGGDEPNNLVTACADCNSGKSSIPADAAIIEDVDATAMLFARAIERAAEIQRADTRRLDALVGEFDHYWESYGGEKYVMPRSDNWVGTVENYLAAGLTVEDLKRNVDIAMSSSAPISRLWRYFCGVTRNQLVERQELARRLIEDGQV